MKPISSLSRLLLVCVLGLATLGHPPAAQSESRAGTRHTFAAKGVTFAMRFIPAGSFTMGSPKDEKQRDSDEGPQRQVRLTQGFWMLETEVTQRQYKALVGENPSSFKDCGDTCPVERVSWHDAAVFANTLSAQQNLSSCFSCKSKGKCDIPDKAAYLACKGWRLPTEAEWEYAARAGTTTRFHTGDCITPDQANFDGNSPADGCPKGEDRGKPVEVGSFAANAWGLHDMHGNVWEWVADGYERLRYRVTLDPLEPTTDRRRAVRGGSWLNRGGTLRSAVRGWTDSFSRYHSAGFRLLRQASALSTPPPQDARRKYRIHNLEIQGDLKTEDIQLPFQKAQKEWLACCSCDTDATQRAKISLEIGHQGSVIHIEVAGTLTTAQMKACLASRLKLLRFPPSKDGKPVRLRCWLYMGSPDALLSYIPPDKQTSSTRPAPPSTRPAPPSTRPTSLPRSGCPRQGWGTAPGFLFLLFLWRRRRLKTTGFCW